MHHHRLKMLANVGAINCAEEPTAPSGGSAPEPQAGEAGEQSNEAPKETHPWDSPEVAKAEIERLRREAAGYRTRKTELEQQLEGAKSQEDIDTAISEWKTKTTKLERENLILQHGATLPETLRKYVQGDTEEQIKASVEELAATVTPKAPTPPSRVGGGLNPGAEPDVTDPGKLAAQVRSNSRFPRI